MSGEVALTFLLQTLKEVLTEYKNLKAGARHELEQLENELGLLESFLMDSAKKSEKTEYFRKKESQIRELVYEVEDTIEIHLTKKAAAEAKTLSRFLQIFRTATETRVKSLRQLKVRPMIVDIEQEFRTNLVNPRMDVKLDQSMGEPPMTFLHNPSTEQQSIEQLYAQHESLEVDKVVDFEEEATIIRHLMESKLKLDVISITGAPGMGKTTLAKKIYNEPNVCDKFPNRMWAHVSSKFNSRNVFLNILEQIGIKTESDPSEADLIRIIRRRLEFMEFLLVMDDVWTDKDWEVIKKILPEKNGKGKVLVTSRQNDVGVLANLDRKPHRLSLLPQHKRWELLELRVFGTLGSCPLQLAKIGENIANKCGGIPLQIVVLGGFLRKQFATARGIGLKEKWEKVLADVNKILEEDKEKTISDVLDLSYNVLAHDLRVCFLYTGLFPEDHEIPVSTLTQLWIAEGFVRRERGKSFEESAEEILNELINMNLLVVKKKSLDQVKACRVHDMIREFCKAKAMEENLFTVITESKGVIEPPLSELQKSHRLCLQSNLSKFFSAKPNGPRVRSFLCFFDKPLDLDPIHSSAIPKSFNLLRVLNCKSVKFEQFPKVANLILLKHITLSIDYPCVLPEQISHLLNLRTLIIDTTSHSIKVKANIWKMMQLRQLKTKAAIFLDDKNWKSKVCENLQTISRLSPESCKATLSERAPNLKRLGIRGKLANLSNTFSLEKLVHLEKLELVNEVFRESPHSYQLDSLPPKLKSLTLSNTRLKWDVHMPLLAKINTLKVLKLKDSAFVGTSWNVRDVVFENLQFLLIKNTDLVFWKASHDNFPLLCWLVLKTCKLLQNIPKSIGEKLEELEIEDVNKAAADSALKIESTRKQAEKNENSVLEVPFKLTIGPGCTQ